MLQYPADRDEENRFASARSTDTMAGKVERQSWKQWNEWAKSLRLRSETQSTVPTVATVANESAGVWC